MVEVKPDVSIRPLREGDLSEADRIMRLAFGTFFGLPEPTTFMGDAGYMRTDTLLLWDNARLVGFAACHVGAGTEAGSGACYIKFGVIRPGHNAGEDFERLLDACEAMAATLGAQLLTAGANMGRHEAYRAMRQRGFRTDIQGVAMQRSNDPGYHVPGVYIIDDWR